MIGGDLPASMELYDLPPNIAADIPATKLYKYTLVQNQVVIVDPTKILSPVAVISDAIGPSARAFFGTASTTGG